MSALVLYTPAGGDGTRMLWPPSGPEHERWTFVAGTPLAIDELIGYGDASITFEDGRAFPQHTPAGSSFYHCVYEDGPYPRPVALPPEPMPTPPAPPPVINPPVVSNATFSLDSGATLSTGQVVGTMAATNSPSGWTITAGNSAGNFAIDTSGAVLVAAAGVMGLHNQTGTAILTVRADNAGGSGLGTATVNYQPATPPPVFVPPSAPTGLVATPL
jgi:hypothetical protein